MVTVTSPWTPAGLLSLIAVVVTAACWPRDAMPTNAEVTTDFSPAQIARAQDFHQQIRPWQLAAVVVSVIVPVALGIWLWRNSSVRDTTIGHWLWWVQAIAAMAVVTLAPLPLLYVVHKHVVSVGLSSQADAAWLLDIGKQFMLSVSLVLPATAALVWLSQRGPITRTVLPPAGAVVAVVAISLVVPVVVEPLFNRFEPLPKGPLQHSVEALIERSGMRVDQILVSDASRRTTALNAYVSGFGATRRVVVNDTLTTSAPPEEVTMVVAHELGHVAHRDVLRNTAVAAVWVAAGVAGAVVCAPLVAGIEVVAVLAAGAVASQLTAPVQSAFSRAVERSADSYALSVASSRDQIVAFAQMQHRLAITNLSSLTPPSWAYTMYATHPLAPQRIAAARAELARRGWGALPAMSDT